MRRKFFGSARALPSRKNCSPLATRYSLPFLARQEPRPPNFVPRPASHAPFCFCPLPMSPAPLKLMRVDELWKMRYGFMGKTQIDG